MSAPTPISTHAVENLVDGAFFNSGQSCCGIERIYVHERLSTSDFVERAAALTRSYVLGDPTQPRRRSGRWCAPPRPISCARQIGEAVRAGRPRARRRSGRSPLSRPGTPYLAPQILVDVDHSMRVMREESFGPVVGIMKVASDEEAVRLMNDSAFGLTAAIWTRDDEAADRDRRRARHRHRVHEPLRLPRPGARLDRRQGFAAAASRSRCSATST